MTAMPLLWRANPEPSSKKAGVQELESLWRPTRERGGSPSKQSRLAIGALRKFRKSLLAGLLYELVEDGGALAHPDKRLL